MTDDRDPSTRELLLYEQEPAHLIQYLLPLSSSEGISTASPCCLELVSDTWHLMCPSGVIESAITMPRLHRKVFHGKVGNLCKRRQSQLLTAQGRVPNRYSYLSNGMFDREKSERIHSEHLRVIVIVLARLSEMKSDSIYVCIRGLSFCADK